ncbi:amino acid adenylation domain-containing protein [Kitasatospora cinereorecta]|uniref:Amino acid adenylation domain-containing protein n=1 Tax=Kitasatospora cinereorecta TaxID=285560 RepID=A0ABW0VJW6_9ACTN
MYGSDPAAERATPAQSGIWFTERLGGLGTVYSMPFAVTFRGPLDEAALLAACRAVLARHPVLGTALPERDGLPVPVRSAVPPVPAVVDLAGDPAAAAAWEEAEIRRPFDLERGPLIRCTLLRTAPDTARLLVVAHHLVFDGHSTSVFLTDLAAAYAGQALPPLPADPGPGPEERIAAALPAARAYWQGLDTGPAEVRLPGLHGTPRPAAAGAAVAFTLDPGLRGAIDRACAELGLTAFHFTLAGWLVLLRRYGNRAPVVGVDLGTRGRGDRERIGVHVNELPVASAPDLAASFRTYTRSLVDTHGLRSDLPGLYRHREVPLARAAAGVRPGAALAPVTLGYRRRAAAPVFPGVTAEIDWALPNLTARGALRIHMVDGPEAWRVMLQYDPEVLDPAGAERIAAHWRTLARALAEHPDTPLAAHPLDPADTAADADAGPAGAAPTTLTALVEEQAARTPDAVAVVEGGHELSYRALLAGVRELAARLPVGPGDLVALLAERSAATLTAQLAILHRGAAYLPIDPHQPAERLAGLLADARPALVVTRRELRARVPAGGPPVLELDGEPDGDRPERARDGAEPAGPAPGDRAYVLYTSGSTGRPKGVEVEHRALAALLLAFRERLGAGAHHRWLALTALTFDIAALELFLPLVSGGRVVIAPPAAVKDGRDAVRLVREHAVTHVQATPSGWQLLLDGGLDEPGLTALAGGEALPPALAAAITARTGRLLNVYGPTETTVWSTAADLGAGEQGIGRPIAGTTVRVLDEDGLPLPDGLPGELWIGGAGVARGYLHRPGPTADRFRPDPAGPPGARRYRTGDLVRRRPDGGLDFLGRLDGQVKLRGHRIELGEIEARLLEHPQVARAAVTAAGEGPLRRLVAHLVPAGAEAPLPEALREHLARTLPEVMVPAVFVHLAELPLTPNGKVDRLALQARAESPATPADVPAAAPAGPVASGPLAEVAAIWCEVLGLDTVEPDADLFDLGGHSLTVAQIAARISARLGVDLPLHVLYDASTVALTAEAVVTWGR